jgi:hypothetical protein
VTKEGESEWEPIKFLLQRTQPMSQLQLRESHTNKRNEAHTSLETLEQTLKFLAARRKQPWTKQSKTEHCRNLPEHTTKKSELLDQARAPPEDIIGTSGKTWNCNNLLEHTTKRLELLDQARAPPEDIIRTSGPLPEHTTSGSELPGQPRKKMPVGQLQTFDRWISQTTWSLETKV